MSEEDYILTLQCEEYIIKKCLNEDGEFNTDEYEKILFNIIMKIFSLDVGMMNSISL